MTTSVMTMEGRRHFKEDVKFSKTQWIIVGVCDLKFPKNNDLYNNCIDDKHIPRIWEEGHVTMENTIELELHWPDLSGLDYISITVQAAEIHSLPNFCKESCALTGSNCGNSEDGIDRKHPVTHQEYSKKPVLYLLIKEQGDDSYQFLAQEKAFTAQDYEDQTDEVIFYITNSTDAKTILKEHGLVLMVLSKDGLMLENKLDLDPAIALKLQEYSFHFHSFIIFCVLLGNCALMLSQCANGEFPILCNFLGFSTFFIGCYSLMVYLCPLPNKSIIGQESDCIMVNWAKEIACVCLGLQVLIYLARNSN